MLHEDLRFCHEDIERLEQAIADRALDDPKHIRHRLVRDHEIASFLTRIQTQSQRGLVIYDTQQDELMQEVQRLGTGDPLDEFYKQLASIKDFHKRYPNEPVENLERAYKKPEHGGPPLGTAAGQPVDVDGMFTGEEAWGRFLDLTVLHEEYLNLPGIKNTRKLTYLQYLDIFDEFTPPQNPCTHQEKLTDEYFSYVGSLAEYLENFIRRTRPLDKVEQQFARFEEEFKQAWDKDEITGWQTKAPPTQTNGTSNGPQTEGTGEGIWCPDCEKEFGNDNVYKAHLSGKKHKKNAEARQAAQNGTTEPQTGNNAVPKSLARLKDRAVAEREYRVRKLAGTLQSTRQDTRVNVERKAGMTDRERQQEIDALYQEDQMVMGSNTRDDDQSDDGEEKVYNPLKLPLAWDGKPIPFWLYKLHGLGVEFPCEICGNYVYMGRRAFDKHFSEPRHIYGLKCLGINQTGTFREITGIEEAIRLWEKIQRDRENVKERGENVIEMEDTEGNVMPERVYQDLEKQGLL